MSVFAPLLTPSPSMSPAYRPADADSKVSGTPIITEATQIVTLDKKGNCLAALSNLSAGQCIVIAPAYRISPTDLTHILTCDFYKYVFYDANDAHLYTPNAQGFLVFGPMSFCSHSDTPNAKIAWIYTDRVVLVKLIALFDIAINHEITIRYSNISEYPDAPAWI